MTTPPFNIATPDSQIGIKELRGKRILDAIYGRDAEGYHYIYIMFEGKRAIEIKEQPAQGGMGWRLIG